MTFRRACHAVATLLLAGGIASCSGSNRARMVYYYGEPWAEASVNGNQGFYLVDTGASITVLDYHTARKAEVSAQWSETVVATTGEAVVQNGWADRVDFAGRSHRNRQVAIQDFTTFRAPGGRRQSGLIGSDFLLEYTVAFDRGRHMIELSTDPAPLQPGLTPHAMNLANGIPIVQVTFGTASEPVWAKLDTGSGYADERYVYIEVGSDVARRVLGPLLNGPPVEQATVVSLAGERTLNVYEYGPVRVFDKVLPVARIVVHGSGEGLFADPSRVLVSGTILNQFDRVEIDYPRRKVWTRQ